MADDDAEEKRPSLEPPKLFRRRPKKKAGPAPEPEAAPEPTSEPVVVDEPEPTPEPETPVLTRVEPDEADEADGAETEVVDTTAEPEPEPEPEVAEVVDSTPEPEPEPEPAVARDEATPEPDAEPDDDAEPEPEPEDEDEPGFTDTATVPVHVGGDQDERAPDPQPEDVAAAASVGPEDAADGDADAEVERPPREPRLVGRAAALVAGLVVGVLLVLLAAGGTATCEAVRGTSACGAALGFPVLIVIIAVATVAGALLLRLWRVPDPASTSFMAVALLAVITGLFLGDALDSWITRIAFPLGSALAFLAAWWLTTSFDDPEVVKMARQEREREVA